MPFILRPVEVQLTPNMALTSAAAVCGFPSRADAYLDSPLDLNELPIVNAPATFAAKVTSDSMIRIPSSPATSPW